MGAPIGVVLHEGPTTIVVATLRSRNAKNGAMVQTWILLRETDPYTATRTGEDRAVCGDCPHRPANRGSCYVHVTHAPMSVWRAYHRGRYPRFDAAAHKSLFTGRLVRLGSYGDPAMVPVEVWMGVLASAAGHTGYTHQWRVCDPAYRGLLMASCDSAAELDEARARGWRGFRVRAAGEPLAAREVMCPASAEAGRARTCDTCLACNGGASARASVAIVVHGATAKRFLPVIQGRVA